MTTLRSLARARARARARALAHVFQEKVHIGRGFRKQGLLLSEFLLGQIGLALSCVKQSEMGMKARGNGQPLATGLFHILFQHRNLCLRIGLTLQIDVLLCLKAPPAIEGRR